MKLPPLLLLASIMALSVPALGQQVPAPKQNPAQVQISSQLPAAPPFDEKADARAAIQKAVDTAAIDGIRILIAWGANDDKGSKLFFDSKRSQVLHTFFTDEYRTVNVYVGHADTNLELAKRYGATLKSGALPALTVLDSAGKVIANTDADSLRPRNDPAGIDAEKIAGFLKPHQAPPPDAVALFEAALKQARKDGKTIFVWFSAPW